jgi:hypothetical protein
MYLGRCGDIWVIQRFQIDFPLETEANMKFVFMHVTVSMAGGTAAISLVAFL